MPWTEQLREQAIALESLFLSLSFTTYFIDPLFSGDMTESNKRARSIIEEEKEEKGKSEKHYKEDGDLEIISSDDIRFKIYAYQLQATS